MRKLMLCLMVAACLMIVPIGVQAYTVTLTDPANDAIGAGFETTSLSYTVNETFTVDITTVYRLAGLLVGGWQTYPADLLAGLAGIMPFPWLPMMVSLPVSFMRLAPWRYPMNSNQQAAVTLTTITRPCG